MIAALRLNVRTMLWDRQCREDGGGRGQHCLKPITHWLMILSSHLATPFSHSLLLLTLHKSNVGSSTVHSPQVVRKALPRPRGSVWQRVSVCMFSPKLLSRCRFLHNFIAAVLFFVSLPVCLVSVSRRVCAWGVFWARWQIYCLGSVIVV